MQSTPPRDPPSLRCDVVVGTRPEAIKLAPVVIALRDSEDDFSVRIVASGQHCDICRSALAAFGLTADSVLDTEPISGSLADSAGDLLRAFGRRFAHSPPDLILVQGDTTTVPRFVDVMTAGNRWPVGRDIANDDAEGGGDRLRPDSLVAQGRKGYGHRPRVAGTFVARNTAVDRLLSANLARSNSPRLKLHHRKVHPM